MARGGKVKIAFGADTGDLKRGVREAEGSLTRLRHSINELPADRKVKVSVSADNAGFKRSVSDSETRLGRFKTAISNITKGGIGGTKKGGLFGGLESGVKNLGGSLASITPQAAGAAAGLGALAAVGLSAVKETLNLAAATAKLQRTTSLSTRQSSQWITLMGARGVAATQVQKSFQTLTKQMEAGATGSKKAAAAFKGLGVSQDLLRKGNLNAVLIKTADTFKAMPDGPRKTALALQLFGRQGTALIPILNQGSRGMRKMLGDSASMSAGQVKDAKKLAAAQRDWRDTMLKVQLFIGTKLIPAINAMSDWLSRAWRNVSKGKGTFQTLRTVIEVSWKAIQVAFLAAYRTIKTYIDGIIKIARGLWTGIKSVVNLISDLLHGRFGQAWKDLKSMFRSGVKVLVGVFQNATAPFRAAASAIGDVIGGTLGKAWDAILGTARSVINTLIDIVNVPIKFFGLKGIGHLGGKYRSIPGLHSKPVGRATGGFVDRPMVIVGEEAPTHPEYVIATNPAYRQRNIKLWADAGKYLGMPGFRRGGVYQAFAGLDLGGIGSALSDMANPILGPTQAGMDIGKAVGGAIGKLRHLAAGVTGAFLHPIISGVVKKAIHYLTGLGSGGGGGASMAGAPQNLVTYDGQRVAAWMVPALNYARSHGWGGVVHQGWRSIAEQRSLYYGAPGNGLIRGVTVAAPGQSNHQSGNAVDVTDWPGLLRAMTTYRGRRLIWRGMSDRVHFSIDGHRRGGILFAKTGAKYNTRPDLSGGRYSIGRLVELALAGGFHGENAAVAAAVAMAESAGNPRSTNTAGNYPVGSRDRGLWQFNSYWNSNISDAVAYNPLRAARAARNTVASRGWKDWVTWKRHLHDPFMPAARAALARALARASGKGGNKGGKKPGREKLVKTKRGEDIGSLGVAPGEFHKGTVKTGTGMYTGPEAPSFALREAREKANIARDARNPKALLADEKRLLDLYKKRLAAVRKRIWKIGRALAGPLPRKTRKRLNAELVSRLQEAEGLWTTITDLGGTINDLEHPPADEGATPDTSDTSGSSASDDAAAIASQAVTRANIATARAQIAEGFIRTALGPGDINAGAGTAWGAAGGRVNININTLHPGDPQTLAAISNIVTSGLSMQGARTSSTHSTGV